MVDLMREVASELILPRFMKLRDDEVTEKSPGEIVTTVDRMVESRLTAALRSLLPGSSVIGEEQAAADPAVMERLGDDAAWLLDISADHMATAEIGAGAFIDGRRVRALRQCPPLASLRGAVLARFMPPETRAAIERHLLLIGEALPGMRCAGLEYPAVATAAQHFALFWRTLPWDHAPGALLLTEAGGRVARLDGSPYRLGDDRTGLLAAANHDIWDSIQAALVA